MRPLATTSLPLVMLLAYSPPAAAVEPQGVSPGAADRAAATWRCPTFSWGYSAPGGRGFDLAVFAVAADGALAAEPTLRQRIAPGATSWTPPTDRCLAAGSYAWTIRAVAGSDEPAWSDSRFFTVAEPDAAADLESAVERVLERWLAEGKLVDTVLTAREPRRATVDQPSAAAWAPSESPTAGAAEGTPSFVADTALFDPPACQQDTMFQDVPQEDSRCPFIEQFAVDQISTQCAPGPRFCPDDPVTRGQLAVFMERAMRGTAAWDVNADLFDGLDSSVFARRNAANTFTAADTFNGASNFPGSGIWGTNGRVGIGTTSPDTALDIHFPNGDVEFGFDGGVVPGINVNTTSPVLLIEEGQSIIHEQGTWAEFRMLSLVWPLATGAGQRTFKTALTIENEDFIGVGTTTLSAVFIPNTLAP